ncbi:MAG: imidazole glycerol phosphate synthase subunit HisH [Lachnospiraceae bacterium]|nr:imidazole glycerol phosphate synthase subunit HisH [Lachnospiraceae bacterium]
MIAIIDYDAGNIKSVEKAFEYLGEKTVLTSDRDIILAADKVILPGVGAFGDAMAKLKSHNLVNTIYDVVDKKTPFMGICLGLQLLFENSEESEGVPGLGILKGDVVRFPDEIGLKIPQIGWNSLNYPSRGRLFEGIPEESYVYFVHSYYLKAKDPSIVKATTEYGVEVHASVEKDNVFACQFHPEKSGDVGLAILKNFAGL